MLTKKEDSKISFELSEPLKLINGKEIKTLYFADRKLCVKDLREVNKCPVNENGNIDDLEMILTVIRLFTGLDELEQDRISLEDNNKLMDVAAPFLKGLE